MRSQPICAKLEQELGELETLSRRALVDLYQDLLKGPPPKGLSRKLLILSIGYEMQAKRYATRRPKVRARLERGSARRQENGSVRPGRARTLQTGMRLMREWNGITHRVDVDEQGLVWQGKHYASLSAVARAITGARWSGPRFFGVVETPRP